MKINGLIKKYKNANEETLALNGITYEFPKKGLVVITGKSGCGKTTLLYALAGLIKTDSGKIYYQNVDLTDLSEKDWDDYRNANVGFVFQDYKLLSNRSVEENLKLALDIQTGGNYQEKIEKALTVVGLPGYEKRIISELSGGQKQRIAIARALVKNSNIILADEPTGNLDEKNGKQIWELLRQIAEECLIVAVTHDKNTAMKYADLMVEMFDGNLQGSQTKDKTPKIKVTNDREERVFTFNESTELFEYIFSLCRKEETNITVSHWDEKSKVVESVTDCDIEKQTSVKPLSINYCFWFAMGMVKKRWVRHFLTGIMLSLSIVFAYISALLFSFSYGECVTAYMKDSASVYAEMWQKASYKDGFENTKEKYLKKGENLYNTLLSSVDEKWIIPARKECILSEDQGRNAEGVTTLYNSNISLEMKEGHLPQAVNEIAITDYLASFFGNNCKLGSSIMLDKEECTIVGIIKTDYKEYDIYEKIKAQKMTANSYFKLENEYLICVRSQQARAKEHNVVPCSAADFTKYNKELGYINSSLLFASDKTDNIIISGRHAASENEVVVSRSLFERMLTAEKKEETFSPVKIAFLDMRDSKYNDYFLDVINLYDILPKESLVVGVCENDESDIDVWLHRDAFDRLETLYSNYYDFDCLYVATEGDLSLLSKTINEKNLYWNEPSSEKMYLIADTINSLKKYICAAFVGFLILFVIMLVNCVSFSIKDSSEMVGILRAIGVRNKAILTIFGLETLCVIVPGIAVADVIITILVNNINNFANAGRTEGLFNLFDMKWQWIGTMNILVVLLGFLAVFVPVFNFSKKKVIELLK